LTFAIYAQVGFTNSHFYVEENGVRHYTLDFEKAED